ncbi:lipoprotein [Halomonas sp. G15]|nr:lipoprotein [Halomonas sp. G15]MCE0732733.1 lipoprotein [Halomonas sp. G15]
MARLAVPALGLALILGLAGCGQKGPLYLPDDEQAAEQYGPRDDQQGEEQSEQDSTERDDTEPRGDEE